MMYDSAKFPVFPPFLFSEEKPLTLSRRAQ